MKHKFLCLSQNDGNLFIKLGDNVKEIKDTVVEECVKGNACNLLLLQQIRKNMEAVLQKHFLM